MPLVRIELTDAYSDEDAQRVSAAIHRAIVSIFGIPERDKFHVLQKHAQGALIAEDAGLGFMRSNALVIIQIFTQRGRTKERKQELYAKIQTELSLVGVAGNDIFIGYQENGPEDWSFGFGRAQYLTGELAVPSAI